MRVNTDNLKDRIARAKRGNQAEWVELNGIKYNLKDSEDATNHQIALMEQIMRENEIDQMRQSLRAIDL